MINEISFNKSSNVFLNSGIIGLYIYLGKQKRKIDEYDYEFSFKLEKDELKIESNNIMKLLEDVYYNMGKDYYDISNKKQREEADKYYFTKEPFQAFPFAKMNTLGLAGLITNNPTATANKNGSKIKFEKLLKEDCEFAKKIALELIERGKKLKFFHINNNEIVENEIDLKTGKRKENNGGESEIFLYAGYTKTPDFPFIEEFIEKGNNHCSLTGEGYKKLISAKTSSPLLGAIYNYESFGNFKSRDIGWKASYLSKFSPVLSLHMYIDGLDKIVCYFFQADNLINSYKLFKTYKDLFLDKNELIENNYLVNFRLMRFDKQRKSDEKSDKNTEFVWQSEILFMLLYTYYRKFFFNKSLENEEIEENFDDYEKLNEIDEVPVSLTYFRADSFAKTMRPYLFEQFNHYKFIISLLIYFEKNDIDSKRLWQFLISIKYLKKSERGSLNKYKLDRKLRNEVLGQILDMKPIISEIETLFYNCYGDLISGEHDRYRDYILVSEILFMYEPIIKYGGNETMNEELQEKAIKLGSSIGMGIINFDSPEKKADKEANIKSGRKYIIGLKKARTLQQFLDEIVRIETKYGTIVNEDLLKSISDDNWEYIKSFCIISALNKINIELLPQKKSNEGDVK